MGGINEDDATVTIELLLTILSLALSVCLVVVVDRVVVEGVRLEDERVV